MTFWGLFSSSSSRNPSDFSNKDYKNSIYDKARSYFPDCEGERLVTLTCMAGLLARVAYVDFDVDKRELDFISRALGEGNLLTEKEAKSLAELAISEVEALSGLENHLYCNELNEHLSRDQRYQLLQSLFLVAASDEHVENKESEEIRLICKGLLLEHHHFIAARARVKESLGVLKRR